MYDIEYDDAVLYYITQMLPQFYNIILKVKLILINNIMISLLWHMIIYNLHVHTVQADIKYKVLYLTSA